MSITLPELKGVLVNTGASQLSMYLHATRPHAQPRLRRGTGVPIHVTISPRSKVSVPDLLGCSVDEAMEVIRKSPEVRKFHHKGLLSII